MRLVSAGPFPPYRGGIAQFTSRLTASLEKRCEVLRLSYSRLYPSLLFPGRSQFEPGSKGPPAGTDGIDSCNPLAWGGTRRHVESAAPDFALIQWWHPFFAPAIHFSLPAVSGLPRVAICHNVLPHEGFPLDRFAAGRFLGTCGLLVVHGGQDEELARGILPGARILRLFHPIYDQYLEGAPARGESRAMLGYGSGDRVILFFGLIRPYKGLDDLLEAVAGTGPEVKLLIAGECYGHEDALRRRLSQPDLEGRVRWTDSFVPDGDVGPYFRAADVVALPYRNATQSGVAQIALAFRKPLVLTRTGGLPELVDEGRTGFLAEPASPDDLRRAVLDALDLASEPGVEDLVAAHAARFSWDEYSFGLLEGLA